jgi:hypothetical protein
MAIKITNGLKMCPNFTSQGLPKYTNFGIFGLKIYAPSGSTGAWAGKSH